MLTQGLNCLPGRCQAALFFLYFILFLLFGCVYRKKNKTQKQIQTLLEYFATLGSTKGCWVGSTGTSPVYF